MYRSLTRVRVSTTIELILKTADCSTVFLKVQLLFHRVFTNRERDGGVETLVTPILLTNHMD